MAASAAWFIAGAAFVALYDHFRRGRPLRRFWRLPQQEVIQIVVSTLEPQETNEYLRPTTGMGELRSASFVRQALAAAYPRLAREPNISFSSRFPPGLLRSPLIVVGGGRHNQITRVIADHFRFPFEVESDPVTAVRDMSTGKVYTPEMQGEDSQKDYALIARVPNPYRPDVAAFILRGTHTYGLSGAGQMLSPEHIGRLCRATRSLGPYWQVLLEVECVNEEDFPRILLAASLDTQQHMPGVPSFQGREHAE